MSRALEAERQSALLDALFAARAPAASALTGLRESGERLQRGLGAYRANGSSIAERALAAAYPTLHALVGSEDAAALARALWRSAPPRRGDLAQWGRELPEFIEAQRSLDPWPYLADCARLDAAVQRCESAADAEVERDTLALLAEHPPEALRLRLLPSVQLLASAWPIASLHAAQQPGAPADALERADAAVTLRRGECVVIARAGWRARPSPIDAPGFAWMRALQHGASLADALAQAGADFDVNAWLIQALQQGWLWKAEADPSAAIPEHERTRGEAP